MAVATGKPDAGGKAPSTPRTIAGLRFSQVVPNQHGAWAFLVVPLLLGFAVAGFSWAGLGFAAAWVLSYPLSFYSMRVIRVWLRRRRLTRVAKRDLTAATVWAVPLALVGVPLLVTMPWLLVVALVAAVLWSVSLALSMRGLERGMANDLLLVAQATTAVPLMWAVANDSVAVASYPAVVWVLMAMSAGYFTGTILHVKALIRKAKDRGWHWTSIAYHAVLLIVMAWIYPWFAIPFAVALIRTIVMKPGLRPGQIGAVEIVMSTLVVISGFVAVAGYLG